MKKTLFILGLLAIAIGCKNTKKQQEVTETEMIEEVAIEKSLTISLDPKSGSEASGTVVFEEKDGKVQLTADFWGLTPGLHAVHLHEKSDCSADDATSTGGHWNPTFEAHGQWGSEQGFHRGDIGNINADENGQAHLEFSTDLWCLDCEDESKNILGKAIIVHALADDFVTQPTGNAGGRISCGAIIE